MSMRQSARALAGFMLLLAVGAATAAQSSDFGGTTPEARYFRIDSTLGVGRRGPQVDGYVYNLYEAQALRVRLNVDALDASGQLLERRVVFVPLDVPPHGRALFQARVPDGTASARVSVLSFEWGARGGGGGGM
jgi:hypothetical protein